jgi:hypothetical protein
VSFLQTLLNFLLIFLTLYSDEFASSSTCLHPTDEDRRVSKQIAALERVSKDTNTLWADPRHRNAVVLL